MMFKSWFWCFQVSCIVSKLILVFKLIIVSKLSFQSEILQKFDILEFWDRKILKFKKSKVRSASNHQNVVQLRSLWSRRILVRIWIRLMPKKFIIFRPWFSIWLQSNRIKQDLFSCHFIKSILKNPSNWSVLR